MESGIWRVVTPLIISIKSAPVMNKQMKVQKEVKGKPGHQI